MFGFKTIPGCSALSLPRHDIYSALAVPHRTPPHPAVTEGWMVKGSPEHLLDPMCVQSQPQGAQSPSQCALLGSVHFQALCPPGQIAPS